MSKKGIYKLKKSDDFSRLIYPINNEERAELEHAILFGNFCPVLNVWNNIMLGGYEAYDICMANNIPFEIKYIFGASREIICIWICRNQLTRTDLSDEMRRYLIGKISLLTQALTVRFRTLNRKSLRKFDDTVTETRMSVGKEFSVSYITVKCYENYAEAIDKIGNISEDYARKILRSELKISQERAIIISKFPDDEIEKILNDKLLFVNLKKYCRRNRDNITSENFSVKKMPEYDPDADISSLALTIPSWINMICKTAGAANFREASDAAKQKLNSELNRLKTAADKLKAAAKEY